MNIETFMASKISKGKLLYDAKTELESTEEEDNLVYEIAVQTSEIFGSYALKRIPYRRCGEFEGSAEQQLYFDADDNWKRSHLITPLAYWQDPNTKSLYLALPFLKGKPLDEYKFKKTNISLAKTFTIEIGTALQQLKNSQVIHGDLSNRHVWVTPNKHMYIFDFERVQRITEENKKRVPDEICWYFEGIGELLHTPKEEDIISRVFSLADLYLNLDKFPYLEDFVKPFEMLANKTGPYLTAELGAIDDRYSLSSIENYVSFISRAKILLYISSIEKKYSAETAQVYAEHVKESLTNPNWSFTNFAEEFVNVLPKDQ